MPAAGVPLSLVASAVALLLTVTVVVIAVLVITHQALRGTPPSQRAAILRAVAEIARALRGRS